MSEQPPSKSNLPKIPPELLGPPFGPPPEFVQGIPPTSFNVEQHLTAGLAVHVGFQPPQNDLPSMLARLKDVDADFPQRFFKMVEEDQDYKTRFAERQQHADIGQRNLTLLFQYFGLLSTVFLLSLFFIGGVVLIALGKDASGITSIAVSVVGALASIIVAWINYNGKKLNQKSVPQAPTEVKKK